MTKDNYLLGFLPKIPNSSAYLNIISAGTFLISNINNVVKCIFSHIDIRFFAFMGSI